MRKRFGKPYQSSWRVWGDQRGITGLETAIVLIAFVVVAAVFAFGVITTGLFSSEKASATAGAGLGEATSSLAPKGAVISEANVGTTAVATVKYKVTNAAGADAVDLTPTSTLLTYSDTNNLSTLVRSATVTGLGETAPWWFSEWTLVLSQLGFGNCLRKRLRLLPFFRSVDVGGWQPWDENGMWSGWKGKNETSWND